MAKTKRARVATVSRSSDGMRKEYDFSGGVRGKYAGKFGSKLIFVAAIDPDVAENYPDSKAVNNALRQLTRLAEKQRKDIAARTARGRASTKAGRTTASRHRKAG